MSEATVIHGDCIEVMRTLPAGSVDSIVTDPPYGLGFMGKKWDNLPPGKEWAEECLRVLKPGGHMLAFGGTRTWHRLAVAIEDAGFEMRDSIAWLYGSGFPKHRATLKPAFEPVVMARKPFKGSLTTNEAIYGTGALNIDGCLIETSAEDAVAMERANTPGSGRFKAQRAEVGAMGRSNPGKPLDTTQGRWPANVILDAGMAEVLDGQSGISAPKAARMGRKGGMNDNGTLRGAGSGSRNPADYIGTWPGDEGGGASRFFYVAKAPKRERPVVDGVAHPTVKPLSLMRYLVKLVTPTGGTVLEPFAGSGATVEACILENFNCIAIEREAEYLPLIQTRIERTTAA